MATNWLLIAYYWACKFIKFGVHTEGVKLAQGIILPIHTL